MQPHEPAEKAITIRWHPELLHRLREQVLEQPNPEEPLKECGGLLLGSVQRNRDRIHIVVRLFEPIGCSYQEDRFYHLADADKSTLQQSIERYANAHWSCVGLYRSQCRPGLELDEWDLQVARECLKHSLSIFLLVSANGQDGGLFFFDGREFSRDWSSLALPRKPYVEWSPPDPDAPSDPVAEGSGAFAAPSPAVAESAMTTAHLYGSMSGVAPTRMPGWLACSLGVLVVGLILVWSVSELPVPGLSRQSWNSALSQGRLGLATSMERDHIRIAWNPHAPSVAEVSSGMLLITDGQTHTTIPLDPDVLAHGSVVYHPTSDVASIELRIGGVTESLVAAGLDRLAKETPSLPPPAQVQTPAPQVADPTRNSARQLSLARSNRPFQNAPRPLEQRGLTTLARDMGSEPARPKYVAPPSFRPAIAAPPLLQPPDPDIAVNPTPRIETRLSIANTPVPPPLPPGPPEPAAPEPTTHVDFVAAQPIKRAPPQGSANALRLLVSSVTIRVQVHTDSQGRVVRADSLSHGGVLIDYLSHVSVNAAREWLFAPARREGHDVDSDSVLEFVFDSKGIASSP